MTIAEFGKDVQAELNRYLSPGIAVFRGSFAHGSFDEFSDVDLQACVDVPLDTGFFAGLENCLQHRYGAALVRYDPDYRETTTAQDVRFSFYNLPVFWRVDFLVQSNRDTGQKHPSPFPDWALGTSALMNIVWALKYARRGRLAKAEHYLTAACRKIGLQPVECTMHDAALVLDHLAHREDVDSVLLVKTREVLTWPHNTPLQPTAEKRGG